MTTTKTTKAKQSPPATKKGATPPSLPDLVNAAITSIQGAMATIPLDTLSPADANMAAAARVVSTDAMTLAAAVIEQNPTLFGGYDAGPITAAIAYEQAVTPLVSLLSQSAKALSQSLQAERGAAATQTLALYAALKALSRLSLTPALKGQLSQMAALFKKTPKARATAVTLTDTAKAVKGIKATKVASAKAAKAAAANKEAAAAAATAALLNAGATPPQGASPALPASH